MLLWSKHSNLHIAICTLMHEAICDQADYEAMYALPSRASMDSFLQAIVVQTKFERDSGTKKIAAFPMTWDGSRAVRTLRLSAGPATFVDSAYCSVLQSTAAWLRRQFLGLPDLHVTGWELHTSSKESSGSPILHLCCL